MTSHLFIYNKHKFIPTAAQLTTVDPICYIPVTGENVPDSVVMASSVRIVVLGNIHSQENYRECLQSIFKEF